MALLFINLEISIQRWKVDIFVYSRYNNSYFYN